MRVLFVYSGNSASGKNRIVEAQANALGEAGVLISFFPVNGRGFHGYLGNLVRLRTHLKINKYDIVHAHYGLCGLISFFAGANKLVVSFMGDDLLGENSADGRIRFLSRFVSKLNSFFGKYFYDYVLVKSGQMAGKLLAGTRYSVIPNGVNLSIYNFLDQKIAREKTGINSDNLIVLFVSDPERPEKNFTLAQKSLDLCGSEDTSLLVINGKNPEYLNLYYNSADLLLLTSFHEGSPNVIKEAMACNCPIVSTDVGDVRWLIQNIDGCFVTAYDPAEISKRIMQAADFRRQNRFTIGREIILKKELDSDSVSQRIINIYSELV